MVRFRCKVRVRVNPNPAHNYHYTATVGALELITSMSIMHYRCMLQCYLKFFILGAAQTDRDRQTHKHTQTHTPSMWIQTYQSLLIYIKKANSNIPYILHLHLAKLHTLHFSHYSHATRAKAESRYCADSAVHIPTL